MASTVSQAPEQTSRRHRQREPIGLRWPQALMEIVVLVMVVASPWALGAVRPIFEFLLYCGVALLLLLWSMRALLERRFTWRQCPVTLCLAALFLLGIVQLVPWSPQILRVLSPGSEAVRLEFLPATPEVLPGNIALEPAGAPTISVFPQATHAELIRLLAVIALFAVVRNNLSSPGCFHRLAVVAVANGALLALFGILQFFATPRGTILWSFKTVGQVSFATFINRGHYAFYMNLCIGLGVGLLLASRYLKNEDPGRRHGESKWIPHSGNLLQDPKSLWICVALAAMIGSVLLSMSRGGFLALSGAAVFCLGISLIRARQLVRFESFLLVGLLLLGLLTWVGIGPVQTRLASIWKAETIQQGRVQLWQDNLSLLKRFPILGSGLGTYAYVEPLGRSDWLDVTILCNHADNEYMEGLIEGGVVRLGITLLVFALAFVLGYRAFRQHVNEPLGALALGGLFGLCTVAIQSIGDWGLHIPAIVVLATVMTGMLCSIGSESRGTSSTEAQEPTNYTFRGLAPVVATVLFAVVGLLLFTEGLRAERVDRYRLAALRASRSTDSAAKAGQIPLLASAIQLDPRNAVLHVEAAEALYDRYRARKHLFTPGSANKESVAAILASTWSAGAIPSAAILTQGSILAEDESIRLNRDLLLPALAHYVEARNYCPLLARPQVRIAAHTDRFVKSEDRVAYLKRAKRLLRGEGELWHYCGTVELTAGQHEQAWATWRHCLEITDDFFDSILTRSLEHLSPQEIAEKVLPDKGDIILRAAARLYDADDSSPARQELLTRGLAALDKEPVTPETLRAKAMFLQGLGQKEKAIQTLELSVNQVPQKIEWKSELAQMHYDAGNLREARSYLEEIVRRNPGDTKARELLSAVNRALAER